MSEHPIEGLMGTTMESLKEMVDVNTIVGDPVESPDGIIIIPISKVSFGFASGGSQFNMCKNSKESEDTNRVDKFPFGGGSGAGVSLQPVAFIVVGNGQMKLMSIDQSNNILGTLLDYLPKLANSIQEKFKSNEGKKSKSEQKNEAGVDL